ncbi:MAG: hypothetical protein K8F91_02600 [Candidatus Obscuribacterales bacterium]|nr:hypothetical protein [Candidatus Obscuribacterales bacterium]
MKRAQYRQGDVLLIPVEDVPSGSIQESQADSRVILAYGEVTGHAHAIDATLAKTFQNGDKRYLEVDKGAVLKHEEHSPLLLAPGSYRVVVQREYEPAGWRRVAD